MRVAVAGKGGSGKSVLAGTLARVLARRGMKVLALDSDVMPGLALTLGARPPAEPALMSAAERGPNGRWRFTRGHGAVRAVQRFACDAPDGVRFLELGNVGPGGQPAIMPAVQAFFRIVHGIGEARALRDWSFVGDLPAGPRQVAFDWAPYARRLLVVVEPTMQSLLTARRVARVASMRDGLEIAFVASKIEDAAQRRRIEDFLGPLAGELPLDPAVAEAERLGLAVIDHAPACAAVQAVEELVEALEARGSLTNSE